jgi:protein SCO1/2
MTLTRRSWLLSASALATLPWLSACGPKQPGSAAALSFKGVDITGAKYAQRLDMPDTDGHLRSLADFKGKVLVVFFGYVQCPDVCPTTMAELAGIKKALGPQGDQIQGIFVTVDPERDSAAILRSYMDSFDPSFIGLRGTAEQTRELAKAFKVFYAKVPGKTDSSYTVDHTAGSYLFDKQGKVRVFSRYGTTTEDLTQDLKGLLSES